MEPDWEYIDSIISANWLRMSDGQLAKLLGIRKCHVKKRRLVDLKLVKDWKTPSVPKREAVIVLNTRPPPVNYKEEMEKVLNCMRENYKGNEVFKEWIYTREGQFIFYREMTNNHLPVFACRHQQVRRKIYEKSRNMGSRGCRNSNRDDL